MQFVLIVLYCIYVAVSYGIVHDQITARICIEYFTIGHPPIFQTEDPTLLGIGWGIVATWWFGLLLGFPLALAARFGPYPKRSAASIVRPVLRMLGVTGSLAILAGVAGWTLARGGIIHLAGPMGVAVPPEKHVAFLTDLWAHSASYAGGFFGGCLISVGVWQSRRRMWLTPQRSDTGAARPSRPCVDSMTMKQ